MGIFSVFYIFKKFPNFLILIRTTSPLFSFCSITKKMLPKMPISREIKASSWKIGDVWYIFLKKTGILFSIIIIIYTFQLWMHRTVLAEFVIQIHSTCWKWRFSFHFRWPKIKKKKISWNWFHGKNPFFSIHISNDIIFTEKAISIFFREIKKPNCKQRADLHCWKWMIVSC